MQPSLSAALFVQTSVLRDPSRFTPGESGEELVGIVVVVSAFEDITHSRRQARNFRW